MSVQEVLSKFPAQEDYLLEILLEVQKQKVHHDLTEEEMKAIATYLSVSESKVSSVVSFYSLFSMAPKGEYVIQVCHDVPCYVNKQPHILDTLKTLLQLEIGETSEDQMFTLEYTSCLGACDKAPAIRIGEKTYTHLTPDKVKAILAEYRGKRHA